MFRSDRCLPGFPQTCYVNLPGQHILRMFRVTAERHPFGSEWNITQFEMTSKQMNDKWKSFHFRLPEAFEVTSQPSEAAPYRSKSNIRLKTIGNLNWKSVQQPSKWNRERGSARQSVFFREVLKWNSSHPFSLCNPGGNLWNGKLLFLYFSFKYFVWDEWSQATSRVLAHLWGITPLEAVAPRKGFICWNFTCTQNHLLATSIITDLDHIMCAVLNFCLLWLLDYDLWEMNDQIISRQMITDVFNEILCVNVPEKV